jgi:hypothetical protein
MNQETSVSFAELWLLAEKPLGKQQMRVGVWFYGLGTALTGILDVAWSAFDASHQPIKALGNVPGQNILAWVAGDWTGTTVAAER